MKTISIINLKGGVAKTVTSLNMAYALATVHGKKVLLVDNDKQGNSSKTLGIHSYDHKSIADIFSHRGAAENLDVASIIRKTKFEGIDGISANMALQRALIEMQLDSFTPHHNRLRNALGIVADAYDYCIIDNAPDINISTANALTASDEVIIPVKIDEYAFDGLNELMEQVQIVKENMNSTLTLRGCLVTCFHRLGSDPEGEALLRTRKDLHVFDTHIRYSGKVGESTFAREPTILYSERSGAALDYMKFVDEYLQGGVNDGR